MLFEYLFLVLKNSFNVLKLYLLTARTMPLSIEMYQGNTAKYLNAGVHEPLVHNRSQLHLFSFSPA